MTREEMWNFVNAGIITEERILEEIEGIEGIENKEAWAKEMAAKIKEDDFDGNGTTYCKGATYALIQEAHYNAGTGEYEALCIKVDPEYEDGLYKAYWSIKEGCENELEEDMCDWDYADTVERAYV